MEATITAEQYDQITRQCFDIFVEKMSDYGPSWRIFRPEGITDQLYIKAKRIRQLETTGVNLVGDSIVSELMAIVNYGIIALIQVRNGYSDEIDMTREQAQQLYQSYLSETRTLMLAKNHDYGEAWREMRERGLTDMVFSKIIRIRSIEANNGKTSVSEGVESNYQDMVNYAIFELIKLTL